MNNDTITINGFDLSEVIDIIDIIRPVGNERTSRHDDERPARPRVVLGRFDPQREQGEAGKQQESCRVLHGGQ